MECQSDEPTFVPLSCDTMVATGRTTAHGEMLFAKNSDRPADECQPLVQVSCQQHAAGAVIRCGFVELPEVSVTYRHIGSQPYWCWGYEHGFNEHQVVIGNEALPSKVPMARKPKLIGMELIRLGLERARSAHEAVEVMTDLISRYGQGEFENEAGVRTYDNGYIVTDPHTAYVLEAAGHEWAVKEVDGATGISNVYSIGTEWDDLSPKSEAYAAEQGWWSSRGERFDFAGAYMVANCETTTAEAARVLALYDAGPVALGLGFERWTNDSFQAYLQESAGISVSQEAIRAMLAAVRAAPRRARSCSLLDLRSGQIDTRTMMAILADHGDGRAPAESYQTAIPEEGVSICMHSAVDGSGGNTAASLVADLCADGSRLPVYWCSFYSPCLGLFLPMYMEGSLPEALSRGGKNADVESVWWQFHRLSRLARRDAARFAPQVRERWAPLQSELFESAYGVAHEARRLFDQGETNNGEWLLTAYMAENVVTMQRILAEIADELEWIHE